jgi:TM2 domain-containing membrane protein YozV
MTEAVLKAIDEKYCSECGDIIKAKAEICPKCGVRQSAPPLVTSLTAVAPNGKSKLAAALFALFLGGLGIHKFYLGQTGWGIAYILFCWTLIPALVGFIEGILFLVMSESDFNQKYGGV